MLKEALFMIARRWDNNSEENFLQRNTFEIIQNISP